MQHQNLGLSRRQLLRGTAGSVLAVLVGGPALSACSTGDSESSTSDGTNRQPSDDKRIAFSHANSGTPVVAGVQAFATERASETGYELILGNPQQRIDVQVTEIEAWITQGIPAICVFPVDQPAIVPLVQRARDAGIVFTTYAVAVDSTDGALLFSHEQSGQLIGEHAVAWVNEHLDGEGRVLLLGDSTIPDLGARTGVPKSLLEEDTNSRIVVEQDAFDPNSGLEVTEATLQAHPDLNCVIGLNDDGALGAMRAFENAGRNPDEVYIAGQDGAREALEAIAAGGFYKASAALPLRDIGYGVIDLNAGLLSGDLSGDLDVPPILVTQDDAAAIGDLLSQWDGA